MSEPTNDEKRAFWQRIASDPTVRDTLREMTTPDITTITEACWRGVLDPEWATAEFQRTGEFHHGGLLESDWPHGPLRPSPAGHAAIARLREIADGLSTAQRDLLDALVHDGPSRWSDDVLVLRRHGLIDPAEDDEPTPLGRAVLAYLEGRGDG